MLTVCKFQRKNKYGIVPSQRKREKEKISVK